MNHSEPLGQNTIREKLYSDLLNGCLDINSRFHILIGSVHAANDLSIDDLRLNKTEKSDLIRKQLEKIRDNIDALLTRAE